jgi:hypothetical protein
VGNFRVRAYSGIIAASRQQPSLSLPKLPWAWDNRVGRMKCLPGSCRTTKKTNFVIAITFFGKGAV